MTLSIFAYLIEFIVITMILKPLFFHQTSKFMNRFFRFTNAFVILKPYFHYWLFDCSKNYNKTKYHLTFKYFFCG